jgi:hypothetical protein
MLPFNDLSSRAEPKDLLCLLFNDLSSRAERSAVEGSAVAFRSLNPQPVILNRTRLLNKSSDAHFPTCQPPTLNFCPHLLPHLAFIQHQHLHKISRQSPILEFEEQSSHHLGGCEQDVISPCPRGFCG